MDSADLAEAARRVPKSSTAEQNAFAERQLAAQQRVEQLRDCYGQIPCLLARLHLLTASSVASWLQHAGVITKRAPVRERSCSRA